jgi:hypothetical protein
MIIKLLKKYKYIAGILAVAFFAVIYSSCDITNPTTNLAVIFNTLSISTNASVSFVDAATGVPIGSSSNSVLVNVNFTGPGASQIVSSLDESISSISTKFGLAVFGVSSSFTPTAQNPVIVTLVASSSGYQTTSYPINIQSTGDNFYTIHMIKISAPPAGTSTALSTPVPTNSSGTTTATTTVTTSTETTSGGSAGLTINSGTSVTDANGKSVTGTLTANVTYFSGTNASATGALPTGLSVGVINQDGSTSQGSIQPAAFASFTLTNQSGQLATNFSSPVTMTFTVSGSTINPLTNAAIANGDTVPIYSFDQTSQNWKFETNATAVSNGSGGFTLTFQVSHLSNWLAGWILSGGKVCTNNVTLNITGSFSALTLKLKAVGQTILTENVTSGQNSLTFKNLTLPKGIPVTLEAWSLLECPATLVGTTTVQDLCSVNTINLPVNASGNRTDVECNVTAFCKNQSPVLEVKPSGYTIYVMSPCGNIDVGTVNNGSITLHGFLIGQTYTFGMVYKNSIYTQDHTVQQSSYTFNYDIADSVCNADFK